MPLAIQEYAPDMKSRQDCLNFGGIWKNQDFNFDNIGNTLLALISMITKEGWMTFMNNAVDSTTVDYLP